MAVAHRYKAFEASGHKLIGARGETKYISRRIAHYRSITGRFSDDEGHGPRTWRDGSKSIPSLANAI